MQYLLLRMSKRMHNFVGVNNAYEKSRSKTYCSHRIEGEQQL